MALQDRTIAFIGGGHITSIIVENLVQSNKMAGRQLVVSDPDPQKLEVLQKKYDVQTTARNLEARETSTKIAYHTIAGSMALWNARQVSPYELIGEASSPGGISTEIMFTLEKRAFKAIIGEALEAGRHKAAEFSRDRELP